MDIIILSEESVKNFNFTPPEGFSVSRLPSKYDMGINLNGDPNEGNAILYRPHYEKGSYSQRLQNGLWLPLYIPRWSFQCQNDLSPTKERNTVTYSNAGDNETAMDYEEMLDKRQKYLKKDLPLKIKTNKRLQRNKKKIQNRYRYKYNSKMECGFSHTRLVYRCPDCSKSIEFCDEDESKSPYSVERYKTCNDCLAIYSDSYYYYSDDDHTNTNWCNCGECQYSYRKTPFCSCEECQFYLD